jgi:hypothetical protein
MYWYIPPLPTRRHPTQIMIALQEGQRPLVPPDAELPGQLGAAGEVAEYVRLVEECWDR